MDPQQPENQLYQRLMSCSISSSETSEGSDVSGPEGTDRGEETSYMNMSEHGFEQIRNSDTSPSSPKWAIEPIYKETLTGKDMYWQIGFDPETSQLVTWFGYVGGVKQVRYREVSVNKSGRTLQEQALLEARKKYKDKFFEGYLPAGSTQLPNIKIMSADKYASSMKINFPVDCEKKLNGIRLWTRYSADPSAKSRGSAVAKTRSNQVFVLPKHLEDEMIDLFSYLPPNCALDGEMHHPDLTFEQITSAFRTVKTCHPLLAMLEFNIFDLYMIDNPPREIRRKILGDATMAYYQDVFGVTVNLSEDPRKGVPGLPELKPAQRITHYGHGGRILELIDPRTADDYLNPKPEQSSSQKANRVSKLFLVEVVLAYSHEEIAIIHNYFTSLGEEGTMIKKRANGAAEGSPAYKMSQYLFGRGRRILKHKDFIDEEAVCIGVTDAKGKEKGCAMLTVCDIRGNTFSVRMKGSFERRQQWLLNPEEIVHKSITIRYQCLSSYGVPIFPVGVEVRDYEGPNIVIV